MTSIRYVLIAALAAAPTLIALQPGAGWAIQTSNSVAGGATGRVTAPHWLAMPSPSEMVKYYPARAYRLRISGQVVADCIVAADGALKSCKTLEDSPAGFASAYGDDALYAARAFRLDTKGGTEVGKIVRVTMDFDAAYLPPPQAAVDEG
jgi:TonB family protein